MLECLAKERKNEAAAQAPGSVQQRVSTSSVRGKSLHREQKKRGGMEAKEREREKRKNGEQEGGRERERGRQIRNNELGVICNGISWQQWRIVGATVAPSR